ncbi:zinc finger protein Xfin-like [Anopheles stephensi]|uniref:zinc finger protein Xfin-like n=1 Tax=Anopheles stephensi TaxID=30069 RepID=UPI001658B371|nr:zinc finger protein Xfin-like [Anopheles stephensi]XP_035904373.1 zinc finger protein Xfin-like [Anopheles stephensi]
MDMVPEQEPEPAVDDDPVDVPNKDPESYCRFCFSENEIEPLFSATGAQANTELLQRINDCLGIKLTRKDYCPSSICWSCTLTMEEFQCFRKRCLKFDALVRSLRPVVKSEPGYSGTTTPTEFLQKGHTAGVKQQAAGKAVRQDKGKGAAAGVSSELTFKCQYCPRSFKHRMYLDQHLWKHRDRIALEKGFFPGPKKSHLNGNESSKTTAKSVPAAETVPVVAGAAAAAAPTPPPATGPTADRPISCEYCPRKFTRKMYYMQHLRRHKPDERLFRCRHCPRSFTSHLRRVGHERKIHLTNPKPEEKDTFSCPKCSRVFKHRSSLRMHLLNHDGQLPYGCDICNCRFYSVSYLALHKKRYHGPNAARGVANGTSIPCLYCSRWFLRECDRSSHIKQMHADMHASKESAAGFNQLLEDCPPADSDGLTDPGILPPNVREPMMVIKEEEPDANDPAPTSAAAADAATATDSGVATDPGAFPFYCYSCAMPFDTEDMYSEHLDDQHPFGGEQLMDQLDASSAMEQDAKLFKCPFCPKTFTRKWSMTQHIPSHMARKGYQCEYCPAIFTRNEYLRTHRQRKHPTLPETGSFKCSYCPRMFHMARYKKVHERIAHIKKGDTLPEGDDTESELAAINSSTVDKMDESSSSMAAHDLHSRASDSYDQTSNDAHSVLSMQHYADLEASVRLAVVLERLPAKILDEYRWQLELYATMSPEDSQLELMEMPEDLPDVTFDDADFDDYGDDDGMDEGGSGAGTPLTHEESNDSGKQMLKRKRSKFGITLHPCPHCTKMFKSRTALRMHALYHSGDLPHRCDECGVQFMRYNQLDYHKTKYHGANSATMAARYSCDYCPRIFLRKQDRTTHQMMVHARDQAESIDASPALAMMKKSKRKDYVCRVCDADFEKYRRCVRHIALHHLGADGEPECKPIKLCHCSICTGIYKKREDWHEHLSDHPSVRPHHCEQCIRRRRKASSRKQVHRCTHCPKAFEHKPNLASHLRIHMQQLRFPCSECGVMYDRYRDLLTHQSRYHSENPSDAVGREPLQRCNFCPRVFTRLRDVKYHQEQVHADRIVPPTTVEDNNGPEALGDEGLLTFGFGPEMFPETSLQEEPPIEGAGDGGGGGGVGNVGIGELPIKPDPDQQDLTTSQ